MLYLKQSTASQSVLIGPFIDDTDGATAETGLTIANTDIRLSKNGGNLAAKNSGGGTHDENGWYTITLDATDTDTVGRLQLHSDVSGALPVFHEFQVLEEAIYDALFGASATGLLPANVTQISGDSTAADNLEADYDGTGFNKSNSTIGTCTTNTDMRGTDNALLAASAPTNFGDLSITSTTGRVDVASIEGSDATDQINAACDTAVSDQLTAYNAVATTDLPTNFADLAISSGTGIVDANLESIDGSGTVLNSFKWYFQSFPNGSADSGSTTTLVDSALTQADDYWNGSILILRDQQTAHLITDFVASTDTITFAPAAPSAVSSDVYVIVPSAAYESMRRANTDYGLDHLLAASVSGSDITDDSIIAQLVSASGTADWDDFDNTTESLQAIRDRGDSAWTTGAGGTPPQLLQSTTIATLSTQTEFTLTAGSADDDAYNGAIAVFTDQSTPTQKSYATISDYVGSTRTVTLGSAPAFTIATGDTIEVMTPLGAAGSAPTAAAIADAVWDEAQSGHATAGSFGEIATEIASILVDTDTTIPGLISGLNDLSAAEVNAEVDTALTDIHLDHLFATTYDPASKPGTADALLNEIVESDSGVSRFTANALEQAPSGGGSLTAQDVWEYDISGVTTADQAGTVLNAILVDTGTTIPGTLTTIDSNVDAILVDTGTTIPGTLATIDTVVDAILVDTGTTLPASIDAVPTATENADALLNRDMSAVSDTNSRSPLNALRFLRNRWGASGGTLTVYEEDDTTTAWTGTLSTDASADPVTGNDPA